MTGQIDLPLLEPDQPAPAPIAPDHAPRHPCLPTVLAIAAAIGPDRLVSAAMRWHRGPFAVGVGGWRAVVSAMGVTGRGMDAGEAARDWQKAAE